jgi:phosphate transport system substrate-binding protein
VIRLVLLVSFASIVSGQALTGQALSAQTAAAPTRPRNIFVGSFGDRPGAARLRDAVVGDLAKSGKFHVVEDPASADATLEGKGEVWVSGYYSMNPRERTVSDSHALYTGYLSVELKNKKGETIWSYLATPHSSSGEVNRDLAQLVVRKLSGATSDSDPPGASGSPSSATLTAAGATFPYPVYQKWFESFHAQFPSVEIHYDPVGSEEGIARLKSGAVDFAGSDVMISSEEYFAEGKPKFLRFPTVLGGVVPAYNLPGVARPLRFTPEILAGIYLGRIRKWNDVRIREVNAGAALPDREIVVIHRADGSGTSYVWTSYLSQVSSEWKAAVGMNSSPRWPVGEGAEGNEGVAGRVRDTVGSIGYVEYIYAITSHMSYGSVRNSAGKFISPDLESILAAARGSSSRIAEDFQTSITNAAGADAYPVASFSWFVVPARVDDPEKKKALKEFLQWMLGPGQNQAAALGYVSISSDVLLREQHMLDRF